MTTKDVIFGFFFLIVFSNCATIHSQHFAIPVNGKGDAIQSKSSDFGLVVSSHEITELSSTYFGVIEFTLENKSQAWIKLEKVSIDFLDTRINKNVKILSGKELLAWNHAIQRKIKIDAYNEFTLLASLKLLADTIELASEDERVKSWSRFSSLGLESSMNVESFKQSQEKNLFLPKDHLLNSQLVIPPGLFEKKYLVLNTKNHSEIQYLDHLFLKYQTTTKQGILKVTFRNPSDDDSGWQYDLNGK
ncbi:MAG: hypothetical protein AAF518_19960 [Spirochaetota bacterium]